MDDLDRMFRRLVQNVRAAYPDYLSQPLTPQVPLIHQKINPDFFALV